jgi:hypothetical protein
MQPKQTSIGGGEPVTIPSNDTTVSAFRLLQTRQLGVDKRSQLPFNLLPLIDTGYPIIHSIRSRISLATLFLILKGNP